MDVFPFPGPYHPHRAVFIIYHHCVIPSVRIRSFQQIRKTPARKSPASGSGNTAQLQKRGEYVIGAHHFAAYLPRRDMAGPGGEKRNLHRRIIHVHGKGAVSFPPYSMVAHAHTVIRSIDYQRVFVQPQCSQPVKQAAYLFIHCAYCRKITGQVFPSF